MLPKNGRALMTAFRLSCADIKDSEKPSKIQLRFYYEAADGQRVHIVTTERNYTNAYLAAGQL